MIKSKHKLSYCLLCDYEIVKCGTCNNNCCNGGSGQVDGKPCPDCDDAYNMQAMHSADPTSVEFEKVDDIEKIKSEGKDILGNKLSPEEVREIFWKSSN